MGLPSRERPDYFYLFAKPLLHILHETGLPVGLFLFQGRAVSSSTSVISGFFFISASTSSRSTCFLRKGKYSTSSLDCFLLRGSFPASPSALVTSSRVRTPLREGYRGLRGLSGGRGSMG